MNRKKMGFADKMLFILGLVLGGVIAVILLTGVIVAVLKIISDVKKRAVQIHSVPTPNDEPKEALMEDCFEQRVAEAIRLHDEAMAGNAGRAETAIEDYILLIEEDLRQPGMIGTKTYSDLVGKLEEAYRRADRHQEAEYCLRRLDGISPANRGGEADVSG